MTLAVRVIPCLDVDNGRVVKGVNFQNLRDAGDPVEMAKLYDAEGADELTFLDITASSGDRETTYDVVRRTAEQVFIPLTVGGGVRTPTTWTSCCAPGRTRSASTPPPSPAPTSSARSPNASAARSWCSPSTPAAPRPGPSRSPPTAAARAPASTPSVGAPRRRAGRGRDPAQLDGRGRHEGRVRHRDDRGGAQARHRPVIASGGAGRLADFAPAIEAGADAVLAASVFHFGDLRISQVKDALREAGQPVR